MKHRRQRRPRRKGWREDTLTCSWSFKERDFMFHYPGSRKAERSLIPFEVSEAFAIAIERAEGITNAA